MTTKNAFTEQEWDLVRAAPLDAGFIVIMASSGGAFRETVELAKVYAETRQQHGQSELLDELVAAKPKQDRAGARSYEEVKAHGLEQIREAIALLQEKATPQEVDDYRQFIRTLTQRVAERHEEDGAKVSAAEQTAIAAVAEALGAAGE